jgi:hypothetical protein
MSCLALVYRAVSEHEWQQILGTESFEAVSSGCEGKHFADTVAGARKFGQLLFGCGAFRIVVAEIPDEAPSLYRWENLDGCGPATYLGIEDLRGVRPRLLEPEEAT